MLRSLSGPDLSPWPPVVHGAENAGSVDDLTVLNEQQAGGPPHLMVHRSLMRQLEAADGRIQATASQLDSLESLQAWQQQTRQRFVQALGGFPDRTPLNAAITGTVPGNGYVVEKVVFESRPRHFVTAALFLPDPAKFAPPYPGILIPCGHSQQGKGIAGYQRAGVLAASNGMAALIYDPIDQGERIQDVDSQGAYKVSGTAGHNRIGVSAALLGWNTATFRVWDGMRAIDYLTSRSDIDGRRIGCMGNSGGGTLTAFLTALDDRITASSPSCYITSLTQVCGSIGPQDAEQNIFGQMGFGMDHAELLLLRSPAPVCLCSARQDYFPIAGARQAFQRVQGVYRRLGQENRVMMAENDGPHGWAEPLRVAATRWMNRWLRDHDDLQVPSEENTGISEEAILATEHGQVMLLPGARSVYDLMREELARLEALRQKMPRDLREAVRRRAGIRPLATLPESPVAEQGRAQEAWGMVRRLTFTGESDVLLPAVLFDPTTKQGGPVLLTHGLGKAAAVERARQLAGQGRPVLLVDLTGFGELQGSPKEFYGTPSRDEPAAIMMYLLGRSLTGVRAEDILRSARWLKQETGAAAVELTAESWAVTAALHASVAEPGLFSGVRLVDRPVSWRQVVLDGARHRYSDVVHGALQDYDLSDLEARLAGARVLLSD